MGAHGIQITGLIGLVVLGVTIIIDIWLGGSGMIKPEWIRKAYVYMPLVMIYICNVSGHSVTDVIKWLYIHPVRYTLIIVLFALAEMIGSYTDSLIAVHRFFKRKGYVRLTSSQIHKISKFGDDSMVVEGEGRCDISKEFIAYSFFSNLTGGLCPLCFLLVIKSLPYSYQFIEKTSWIDFSGVFGPAMVIPGIQQTAAQLRKKAYFGKNAINPDNYRFDRIHIIISVLALWFTTTMVTVWGFVYLVYGLTYFRKFDIGFSFVLPILMLTVFLLYQACSPVSYILKGVNVSAYRLGRLVVLFAISSVLILFKLSIASVITSIACLIILLSWERMIKHIKIHTRKDKMWNSETRWVRYLVIIAFCLVIIIVVIQMLQI